LTATREWHILFESLQQAQLLEGKIREIQAELGQVSSQ
jgi:hypothetical protein